MTDFRHKPTTVGIRDGQIARLIGAEDAPVFVLAFHGGGGVAGGPEMMDNFALHSTDDSRVRMAAAQYRILDTSPQATLNDMFEDAHTALAWAKDALQGKLWVLGASFGGLLALEAVLKNPKGVAGLILLNPVTDTGEGGFSNRVVDPKKHAALSPLRRWKGHPAMSNLRCLVVHGTNDDVVPIQSARAFAAIWPKGQSELIELSNASHGFFNRAPRAAETADHVKRFVSAAKPAQKTTTATLPEGVRLLCCIGGQKAGTSWLYDQLAKSPEVHAGKIKERHYFDVLWLNEGRMFLEPKLAKIKELAAGIQPGISARNGEALRQIGRLSEHLEPYGAEKGDHSAYVRALTKDRGAAQVVCDFTPSYCGLSADNLREIGNLGDVRFIYVLRDPVARMWSQIRMRVKVAGYSNVAEKCAEHGHELCDSGRMSQIFRADYARTLDALDQGAEKAKIVFYERLFEQATFDILAEFAGIDPITIDATQRVNEGVSVELPADLEQKMLHALAPQYESVMARFKGDVPEQWHERIARYKTPPPQLKKPNLLRVLEDKGSFLKMLKPKSISEKSNRQIVFLHIPKTAGQSIVKELSRVCGKSNMSPVRTHTQVAKDAQYPKGYRVYGGHVDWVNLEQLDDDRFSFSVLRDPRERIASFYFFIKREAEKLSPSELAKKENTGKRNILTLSADEFFFGGDRPWQTFVHDHYDNFYTTYFATRLMRGWKQIRDLSTEDLIDKAIAGANALSNVYGMSDLKQLESDLSDVLGEPINLQSTRVNAGPPPITGKRWDDLIALFERKDSASKMEAFVVKDEEFMRQIGLGAELG